MKAKRMNIGKISFLSLLFAFMLLVFPLYGNAAKKNGIAKEIVAGIEADTNTGELDLSGAVIDDLDVFMEELRHFPGLYQVDLSGSNLSNEQMEQLQDTFPAIKFVWIVRMRKWSIRTNALAFSTMQADTDVMLVNDDIQVLKYCTDLVTLDLGHHHLTDISVLKYLKKLRVLIISSNNWLMNIEPVSHLPELMYFECWCSRISDISPLVCCQNLVDVNVSFVFSRLNSIEPLMHFPKLERLWFTHSGVSEPDRIRLQERYPDVLMDWTSEDSKSNGWRTHQRFKDLRTQLFNNTVEGDFATTKTEIDGYLLSEYRDYVFDAEYYGKEHPDIVEELKASKGDAYTEEDLFWHFCVWGLWKGEKGCENFDVMEYKASHPILAEEAGDYLIKYYGAYIRSRLNAQNKEI